MSFLAPYYLLGLGGLLVPVLIHLWSRKNPRVIPFGSIRFLPEGTASRTFSLAVTEKLLLLLRLLILALVVMIMADPFRHDESVSPGLILVDPEVADTDAVKLLTDTTSGEVHYLAPRFPVFDPDTHPGEYPHDPWSLVSQAAMKRDSLLILTTDRQQAFRGRRPNVPASVRWITLSPDSETVSDTLISWTGPSLSNHMVTLNAGSDLLQFNRQPGGVSGNNISTDTLRVIIPDEPESITVQTIRQATRSIAEFLDYPVLIHDGMIPDDRKADWLITTDLQASGQENVRNILQVRLIRAGPLVQAGERAGHFYLNGELTPERALNENFVATWLHMLDPLRSDRYQSKIDRADRRRMVFDPVPNERHSPEKKGAKMSSISWPFWIALLLILPAERFLAHRKYA